MVKNAPFSLGKFGFAIVSYLSALFLLHSDVVANGPESVYRRLDHILHCPLLHA